MGLFSSKPKVSKREFSDACSGLYSKGFSSTQVNKVKQIFSGDVHESSDSQKGVDKRELDSKLQWMKRNKSVHGFSDKQIGEIERQLRKRI